MINNMTPNKDIEFTKQLMTQRMDTIEKKVDEWFKTVTEHIDNLSKDMTKIYNKIEIEKRDIQNRVKASYASKFVEKIVYWTLAWIWATVIPIVVYIFMKFWQWK